jgi:hypothetical protein
MALVTIKTVSDMNRVLSAQRAMSSRALRELDAIFAHVALINDEDAGETLMVMERDLIARYAKTPTLADFARNPNLALVEHWGTTFCVTALFGELVLSQVRALETRFPRVHRLMAMLLMKEMDDPTPGDGDLVDTAMRFMQIELRADFEVLSPGERDNMIRKMVKPLVLALLTVMTHFALIANPEGEGFALTETGKEVLRHLFDGQRYIDEVAEAHKLLQKPA